MRRSVELLLLLVALVAALKWMLDPSGHYEPVIATSAGLLALLDYVIRQKPAERDGTETLQAVARPSSGERSTVGRADESATPPTFRSASSCAFFHERFTSAFPGLRRPQWFHGTQAVERLAILLAQPLRFKVPANDGEIAPIWWIGDGSSQIENFRRLDSATRVLLDYMELTVHAMAAVPSADYKRCFVYVQIAADNPVGVYPWTPDQLDSMRTQFGYAWEEYGLYRGNAVTRAEYDDGAAVILGKPVSIANETELRKRFLSPYGFVIVANGSPMNHSAFDIELDQYLKRLPFDTDALGALAERVKALPNRRVHEL